MPTSAGRGHSSVVSRAPDSSRSALLIVPRWSRSAAAAASAAALPPARPGESDVTAARAGRGHFHGEASWLSCAFIEMCSPAPTTVSLEVQEEALKRYAEQHGGKIIRLFKIAETASKADERRVFRELIRFAKKNAPGLDGILFYKVDRAARNPFDYVELERLESEYGVPLPAKALLCCGRTPYVYGTRPPSSRLLRCRQISAELLPAFMPGAGNFSLAG